MNRKVVCLALALGVFAVASCDRHSAVESKYFFTHHLPKAVKAEMKQHYKELLHAPTPSTDAKARSADEPAPSLFPSEGI